MSRTRLEPTAAPTIVQTPRGARCRRGTRGRRQEARLQALPESRSDAPSMAGRGSSHATDPSPIGTRWTRRRGGRCRAAAPGRRTLRRRGPRTSRRARGPACSVMANRGANGIDGVVSTALGAADNNRLLFLVIGDLSFFHDLNGLLAAKLLKLNINIVILNNDGGGIFSYLPQSEVPNHFEVLFGTPTGLDYEHATQMYHGQYTKIQDWESYRVAIQAAASRDGLNVIEIPTDRAKNLASDREMLATSFPGNKQLFTGCLKHVTKY